MTALAAVDGREAMSMIERDDLAIDLLLSDISMPGIGGLKLVAMARARRPALAIVVMSGDNRFALPPDSIGTDVTLVEKPFTLQELTTASMRRSIEDRAGPTGRLLFRRLQDVFQFGAGP